LERNYLSAFGQINSKIDLKEFSDEEKEKKQKDHHLYQLGQKLERFLHELGFSAVSFQYKTFWFRKFGNVGADGDAQQDVLIDPF
jgi:hypothetical protein